MGYKITLKNGLPEQEWDQDDTIATDLLLSVLVPRGAFFVIPEFGLRELPKKITEQNMGLIRQYFEDAWQWLIDAGKAKKIDVTVERDEDNPGRVRVLGEAVQANDQTVPFEIFMPVI